MAKLTVEIDTNTNESSVMVDGVAIENVKYVCISNYSYYSYDYDDGTPKYHFSVETLEKVGDVDKRMSLSASKVESSTASSKYPGLFEKSGTSDEVKTPVGFEISQIFSKGRKVK